MGSDLSPEHLHQEAQAHQQPSPDLSPKDTQTHLRCWASGRERPAGCAGGVCGHDLGMGLQVWPQSGCHCHLH